MACGQKAARFVGIRAIARYRSAAKVAQFPEDRGTLEGFPYFCAEVYLGIPCVTCEVDLEKPNPTCEFSHQPCLRWPRAQNRHIPARFAQACASDTAASGKGQNDVGARNKAGRPGKADCFQLVGKLPSALHIYAFSCARLPMLDHDVSAVSQVGNVLSLLSCLLCSFFLACVALTFQVHAGARRAAGTRSTQGGEPFQKERDQSGHQWSGSLSADYARLWPRAVFAWARRCWCGKAPCDQACCGSKHNHFQHGQSSFVRGWHTGSC